MFKRLKQNIFRSPYQSMAVILNVLLSLFLVSVFFLVGAGSRSVLNFFESKPQVIAYLKDDATAQDIDLLRSRVSLIADVKDIKMVSKEEALKIYQDLFKDKPALLEMVTAKFLPASLEVSTKDISSLKSVAEVLKSESIVEDVDFQEDIVLTLSSWLASLRKFGIILASFLLLNSVLTILVILGMRISHRKEEIDILKLLGASSWYIRSPLFLEGIAYGVISAILSSAVSLGLLAYLTPFLSQFLAGIPLFPVGWLFMLEMLGGMILLGATIGFLGSFLAVVWFMRPSR